MGIDPTKDLKTLVLSHLHHDHADGLNHFEGTDIVVSDENYRVSRSLKGAILGAVPSRWPSWFDPRRVTLDGPAAHSFDETYPLTTDRTVFAVPTPGHMAGHVSVVVRTPEVTYFLAGDATYDEALLKQRIVDGPSENIKVSLDTLDRIAAFARAEPTVLLPAHDPLAEHRLAERITLTDA
jgi:glyoxylase-like metal-dependent hydrolase (beta-lactamase superfamily II)